MTITETPRLSNDEIHLYLSALMPAWDTKKVSNLAYLSGGYSNVNYALDYEDKRFVLRVPQVIQPFVNREHELQWYRQLPADIGVKPLALDAITGAMLTPWVAGELLADVRPGFSLATLASYLRNLHRSLPDADRVYDLEQISAAYWSDGAPPTSPRNPASAILINCHNDLNPWNVIVSGESWITLDWEFVGQNDPLFDLVALHHGLELPLEELVTFATLYLEHAPANLNERLHDVQIAYWVRELGWAHFQISKGNDRDEICMQKENAGRALDVLRG